MYGLVKMAATTGIPTNPEEVKKFKQERHDKEKINQLVHNYLKKNYPEECIYWAKLVDWKLKENVPLESIRMARRPGGAREIDKVKRIAQAVREGEPMEPVVLVKLPDGTMKIADGYHRTLGFKKADKSTIKAWVATVPIKEGPWDKEMHEKKLNISKKAVEESNEVSEKKGSLLGLLGLGAAMHVAPNIAMKAVKSTKKGQEALTGTFSAGLEMGRSGQKLHPNAKSFMEYGIGPESLVDYQLGRKLGDRIKDYSPEKQERFLRRAQGMGDAHMRANNISPEEIDKVPYLNTLKHYMEGKGENKVKNTFMKMGVPEDKPVTWKNHAGNLAMLGGAAAVEPHILMQPTISGVRKATAQSEIGRKFMTNQFKQGQEGKNVSKAKETLYDLAVSPAALDPYRIGRFSKEKLPSNTNESIKKNLNVGDMLSPTRTPSIS